MKVKKNFSRPLMAFFAALTVSAVSVVSAQTTPQRVAVSTFKVTGNTLLPAAEVDAVLAPFKGDKTLAELKQAAAALQDAYRRAGWGAVIAYVPEQAVSAGTATIAVLEGKIAKVVIIGNQQFSNENIRRSLPLLQEGQTPLVGSLDEQIQLANENPSRQLAVTLEPGAKQGEVDARIVVTEKAVSRWSLTADNTGNKQTGHLRASVGWRHANVFDLDHQASLQYQTSVTKPSQVSIVTGSYSVPFYGLGMRLDTYAAYSNVDGGNTATAAGNLQFTGKGNVFGAKLNKLLPRLGEVDQRIALGLDRRSYLNDCRIANLPPGACGPAGESVTVNPMTLEYTVQQGGGGFSAGGNIALSTNLDLGGKYGNRSNFEAVRVGAPLRYTLWRAGAFANPELGGDWRLSARINLQATNDALVSGEQFGLAGANAVRGYAEREIIGDSGVVGSLELMSPDFMASGGDSAAAQSLRLVAFVDAGQVSNKLGLECRAGHTRCSLQSVGLGLRWANGPGQLKLDVARASSDGARTDSGSWKLHVAGSWAFE